MEGKKKRETKTELCEETCRCKENRMSSSGCENEKKIAREEGKFT
jgi:hypothetical protein